LLKLATVQLEIVKKQKKGLQKETRQIAFKFSNKSHD
jgi:hypothetical protein